MRAAGSVRAVVLLLGLVATFAVVLAQTSVPSDRLQVEGIRAGVVKILVTAPMAKTGAGIVIRRAPEEAWIVTAMHVVSDAEQLSVQFPGAGKSWTAEVRSIEFDNPVQGLALVKVTGALPTDVAALPLATDVALSGGEYVTIIGHQPSTGDWGVLTGTISGRKGRELVIQAPIQEQTSGGPVILDGRVVGLVQRKDPTGSFGYANTAQAIREYVEGNRLLGVATSASSRVAQEKAPATAVQREAPLQPLPPQEVPQRPPADKPPATTAPPTREEPVARPAPASTAEAQAPRSAAPAAPEQPSPPAASVGETFRDCGECPQMVAVPAGAFQMGSPDDESGRNMDEKPQHAVTLARPFAVGKYEVTFAEWDACAAAGGCRYRPGDERWGRGDRPVINVSWDDAQAYVAWLSKKTGKPYRLLSEAEWEYAARAGATTRYPWGNEPGTNRANFYATGRSATGAPRQTASVGRFAANAFGLHDMIGNVGEWVQDCWNHSYQGAPADGSAWESGDCARRMVRGGSWGSDPEGARVAYRSKYEPERRNVILGFRVARNL